MANMNFETPILFMVFNRPDCTQKVFERIRSIGPKRLFVAADGPRVGRPGEEELCRKVREIVSRTDWDCDLKTLFRESNLGCKKAVSSAISWFFENVEEGIIIEDDCLPEPTFFDYCRELLIKYRDDCRVTTISGINLLFGRRRTEYSYYFSQYVHIWGWASWRRAWRHYDVSMKLWPSIRDGGWLSDLMWDRRMVPYWTNIFDSVYNGEIDTWDYQWMFASWLQGGRAICPNVNLVSNIGFHESATHTKFASKEADMGTEAMAFPIQHPPNLIVDKLADRLTDKLVLSSRERPLIIKAFRKLFRLVLRKH